MLKSPYIEDPRNWTSDKQSSPTLRSASINVSNNPQSQPTDLPNWVKSLPVSMDVEDIEYLRRKGALTLPEPHFRDACLQSYLENVQPLYPIVDTHYILSTITATPSMGRKVSLLLLQALIFVGSTWIDVRLVRKLGFLSRKDFRMATHRKVRLLYDADYEDDRVCLIQTFVLCNFWWIGPNETKDAWHWIGLALSLSRTIDLHRSSADTQLSPAERRLRKRLWWALVIRDTIGSLGLSRYPRIGDTDYDIPMLEMEDFDLRPIPSLSTDGVAVSTDQQRRLAQLCIIFVKLVCIFGRIFKAAYLDTTAGKTAILYSNQQIEGTNRLAEQRRQLSEDQIKLYENQLLEWRQKIPNDLWHSSALPSYPKGLQRAELAHRGLVSMLYYTAILILHKPQMSAVDLASGSTQSTTRMVENNSRKKVRCAAQKITKIAMDFYVADLIDSLSATCISCLIPASINHVFDMFCSNKDVQSEGQKGVEQCEAIFQAFSDQQFAGPWCVSIMRYIIQRIEQQKAANKAHQQQQHGNIPGTRNLADENMSRAPDNGWSSTTDAQASAFTAGSPETQSNFINADMSSRPAVAVSCAPALPVPFENTSGIGGALSISGLNQPFPDDFASFLDPESSWFQFFNPSEPLIEAENMFLG